MRRTQDNHPSHGNVFGRSNVPSNDEPTGSQKVLESQEILPRKSWSEIAGQSQTNTKPDNEVQNQERRISVPNKKRDTHSKSIIFTGSSATNKKPSVQGVVRKYWLYVGRIAGSDVSIEAIKDYLGDVGENIDVNKLYTKGSKSSFSIGVTSEDVYKTVLSGDFWPEGVLIREFSFRNFFQKGAASRNST
ncbi:hypothetical protein HHI36_004364 [Cryptolaemus montrouzieri]|uniref:Uncharacterized protein n=1 Tax=Cryptolaemus montrouzieri TaxID=559131 RepID=A0ABD2NR56_9CUCU